MSAICGDSNWAAVARTAKGLGLCIRPEGHPWMHRDCFGQTWVNGLGVTKAGMPPPPTDWRGIALYLFDLLDDIDTASDWAKDDDEAYRAVVDGIQADRFKVLHVSNDGAIYPTGDVPERVDFMARAAVYTPREARSVYSMAGAQRALSDEREAHARTQRISDEVSAHCIELERENADLHDKVERQAGTLKTYGDEIDALRAQLGEWSRAFREAEERASRLSVQLDAVSSQLRVTAHCNEDSKDATDAVKAERDGLAADLAAVTSQRDTANENVHTLRRSLQQAEATVEVERARANRAIQRAEAAERQVAEHAETIGDHVALNDEQTDRLAQVQSRLRSLLCVSHAGAVLPRCAKCLYDQMVAREQELVGAEKALRDVRKGTTETLDRLRASTEDLTVKVAGIMAEAAPLLRKVPTSGMLMFKA